MLKKLFLIVFAAFAVLLTGCAGSGKIEWDKARQVREGMSQQEVTTLLGKPYMATSLGDGQQRWVWVHANGFTGASASATLTFKDGKVLKALDVPPDFK